MMCLKHASVQLMVALFKLIAFFNVVCSYFIVSCFYLLFFVEVCRFSFTVDVCRLLSVVKSFLFLFFVVVFLDHFRFGNHDNTSYSSDKD